MLRRDRWLLEIFLLAEEAIVGLLLDTTRAKAINGLHHKEDDIHTALLVSLDGLDHEVVKSAVLNQQVAPTIIKALGLDPDELEAVRKEQISVLPFLFKGRVDNKISGY